MWQQLQLYLLSEILALKHSIDANHNKILKCVRLEIFLSNNEEFFMTVVLNQRTRISQDSLFVPQALGSLSVMHDGREFSVIHPDGSQSAIQRAYLTKELRGVSSVVVQKMSDVGYFSLSKGGSDYALRFDGRLRGGGPLGAVGVFFATWGSGLAISAVGTVLCATGVGAPLGATLIVAGASTMGVAAPLAAAAAIAPTP